MTTYRDFQGTPSPMLVPTDSRPPDERPVEVWGQQRQPGGGFHHARTCGVGLPVPTPDMVPSTIDLRGDAVTGLLRASLAFPGGEVSGLGVDHADALHRLADVITERVAAAAAIKPGVCTCGAREGAV